MEYDLQLRTVGKAKFHALRAIDAVNAGFTAGVNGFASEINAFGACFGTADFKEGTTAFLEKRKADFSGV